MSGADVAIRLEHATRDLWRGRRPRAGRIPLVPYLRLHRKDSRRAVGVTVDAVGSYPTVSPLPRAKARGGLFSVACPWSRLRRELPAFLP